MTRQVPHVHPILGGRRYAAAGPVLRQLLGGSFARIPLDAGFTCPTRDGTLGRGGCLYCDGGGARAAHATPDLPIREQVARGIARVARRPGISRYVAYFQAFTNTYASPERLRELYTEALSDPRVNALAIGTRPDCLDDPILDVLDEMACKTFLWVEMGLQTTNDATLRAMNRDHTVAQFVEAAQRLRSRNLRFCAHVIFGLPGDDREDMLGAAELLNRAGAWGVKLHNLYIDKHSPLAEPWRQGRVPLLTRWQYLDLVVDFLTRLSPRCLIHRLLGETPRSRLLAPDWSGDKAQFLRDLDHLMSERGVFQGSSL